MADLKEFRHLLHQFPELAHCETNTFALIKKRFEAFHPDEILDFQDGGKGFRFGGANSGLVSVFRAELDALPIEEISNLKYASEIPGVSHVCGHDGHMAILTGLGERISKNRPLFGETVLLFQSGEETGTGAEKVCNHPLYMSLKPDHIFALHNIPGLALHTVTTKIGVFSAGSTGMLVEIIGKTSHAAEPENGVNPDRAMAGIIELVHALNKEKRRSGEITFATVVQLQLGEEAFGTSPGYARVLITLRSLKKNGIAQLRKSLEDGIRSICQDQKLFAEFDYKEEFPAIINSGEGVDLVRRAASENKLTYKELDEAFRWSEDFGHYTNDARACFFGLGAGVSQPALHNPDYDFPDPLIDSGVKMFYSIYNSLHHKNV